MTFLLSCILWFVHHTWWYVKYNKSYLQIINDKIEKSSTAVSYLLNFELFLGSSSVVVEVEAVVSSSSSSSKRHFPSFCLKKGYNCIIGRRGKCRLLFMAPCPQGLLCYISFQLLWWWWCWLWWGLIDWWRCWLRFWNLHHPWVKLSAPMPLLAILSLT